MKKILYILSFFPFILYSQVGINTVNPSASLDVVSSKHGVLFPRLELEFLIQELPVTNPNGGSIEEGTMVFNTATVNDVYPGYYYWQDNRWRRLEADPQFMRFTTVSLPLPATENDDVDFFLSGINYTANVFRILHQGGILGGITDGEHGRLIYLYNGHPTRDLKLQSEGGSSSIPANKFSLQNDVVLKSGNSIIIYYDDLYLNRWIVVRSDN